MTNTIENLNENLEKQLLKVSSVMNDMGRKRDLANTNTKKNTTERNKLNGEVKELIKNVKSFKAVRDKNNNLVQEKKIIRKEMSEKLKSTQANFTKPSEEDKLIILRLKSKKQILEDTLKVGTFSSSEESIAKEELAEINKKIDALNQSRSILASVRKSQEIAHNAVQEAATLAQKAHKDMLEINTEIDKKRELAEIAHRKLRISKKEADSFHGQFILAANLKNNCRDMLRAIKNDGGEAVDNAS
jgi:uncharacterized coiled-coil DUF342 family protein